MPNIFDVGCSDRGSTVSNMGGQMHRSWLSTLAGVALAGAVVLNSSDAKASLIEYTVTGMLALVSVNGSQFGACTGPDYYGCTTVTITGIGDTSTVESFNGPASGYVNTLISANISGVLYDPTTHNLVDYSTNFITPIPFQIAVDNTNGGVGFSMQSIDAPTYPLSVYGNAAFSTYDLKTAMAPTEAFWPFCANLTVCQQGYPLLTDAGTISIIPGAGPAAGSFSATLIDVPEPNTLVLFGSMLAIGGWFGRRRLFA